MGAVDIKYNPITDFQFPPRDDPNVSKTADGGMVVASGAHFLPSLLVIFANKGMYPC